MVELGAGTRYLRGIYQSNPVPSSIKASTVKRYLNFCLFVPSFRKKNDYMYDFARSQSLQKVDLMLHDARCHRSYHPHNWWRGKVRRGAFDGVGSSAWQDIQLSTLLVLVLL